MPNTAKPDPAESATLGEPATASRGSLGIRLAGLAVALVAVAATAVFVASRAEHAEPAATAQLPTVGGALHSVFVLSSDVYACEHTVGTRFKPVTGPGAISDVHTLGGAGSTTYSASPRVGALVSARGIHTWQPRDSRPERRFMVTILVDADMPTRVTAVDTTYSRIESDGGRTTVRTPGTDPVNVEWNRTSACQILAVRADGGAGSGGVHPRQPIDVPDCKQRRGVCTC